MTNEEQAKEFFKLMRCDGVEVKRMYGKRYTTLELMFCGESLASRTDILNRGKVTESLYTLPKISETTLARLKGY